MATSQAMMLSVVLLTLSVAVRADDCDGNGIEDADEIASGTAADCNQNNILDLCEVGTTDLILNGDFETGDLLGWQPGVDGQAFVFAVNATFDPPGPSGPAPVCQGSFSASLTSIGVSTTLLTQTLTIPVTASATLHWTDRIRKHPTTPATAQHGFAVGVFDTTLQFHRLFGASPDDPPVMDCISRSADLTGFSGQSVILSFGTSSNQPFFDVTVDDVRLLIPGGGELDCNGNAIPDSCDVRDGRSPDCNSDGRPDECDADCDGDGLSDVCEIARGESPDCNGNGIADACDLDCNSNGRPDECDIVDGTLHDADGNGVADECQILFVDASATGLQNGRSWNDAYTDLQDALLAAFSAPGLVSEIWVAAGTYKPDRRSGDRIQAFVLLNGVGLYGGFAGDETRRDQRDPAAHLTILSGDLAGNDTLVEPNGLLTEPTRTDNSFHVVGATFGTDSTAILDGFIVTGGQADGDSPNDGGGGLFIVGNSSATIRNCTFRANAANVGGGALTSNGRPIFEDCRFERNAARTAGGLGNLTGNPLIVRCRFDGNSADFGGGVANNTGDPTLGDCDFSANRALWGGGLYNIGGDPMLARCHFEANVADSGPGGGMFSGGGVTNLSDCTFHANIGGIGGGFASSSGDVVLTDCDFFENVGDFGGAAAFGTGRPTLTRCDFAGNSAFGDGGAVSIEFGAPTVTDCIFRENAANRGGAVRNLGGDPTLSTCRFELNTAAQSGGAVYTAGGHLMLHTCVIASNAAEAFGGGVFCDVASELSAQNTRMQGNVALDGDEILVAVRAIVTWLGDASAEGSVHPGFAGTITTAGRLVFGGQAHLIGGFFNIIPGGEMIVEGQAMIDLADNGEINSFGLLLARQQATIAGTRLTVNRVRFEGDANVTNNTIRSTAGVPSGQFFIEDTVSIADNDIHADGDRYIDLDPETFAGMVSSNRIFVTVTEGVGQTRGGLLELRGVDRFCADPPCPSGAFALSSVPAFDDTTWTLERLELVADGKVNLTNRFEFTDRGADEVVYVKELVLGANAVLNTAFQRLYYETLIGEDGTPLEPERGQPLANGSRIVDEPLLGFSLNNIAFDDAVEFDTRITHNNFEDPTRPNATRRHITRVTGQQPDPLGMMRMRSLLNRDTGQVVHARAKGLFAKASEEDLLVAFEYLFCSAMPAELIVFLTDSPERPDRPDPQRREVARIRAPSPGRPGAFGSSEFALFESRVSRGDLEFIRGVRVELELAGDDGACVWINNFDPVIVCRPDICAEFSGEGFVNDVDYLTLLSEYGTTVSALDMDPGRWCLDLAPSKDGYVDSRDLAAMDWILEAKPLLNACSIPLTTLSLATARPADADANGRDIPGGTLVVGGKRADLNDRLFLLDRTGVALGTPLRPVSSPSTSVGSDHRANHRLTRDANGDIYQLHALDGLLRLSDGASIVPAGRMQGVMTDDGSFADVLVGLTPFGGRAIQDVAFDESGFAYVAPVVVVPASGATPYKAGAKLRLRDDRDPPYELITLYGDSPAPPGFDNSDLRELRDIEVDGDRVYLTSAVSQNRNDWLLVYDRTSGQEVDRVHLTPHDVRGPVGLHVIDRPSELFVSAAIGPDDASGPISTSTRLYRYATSDLSRPPSVVEINGMGHAVDITSDPTDGTLWVIGFTLTEIPAGSPSPNRPFFEPFLATIRQGHTGRVESIRINDSGLALPLSIVFPAEAQPSPGDCDQDGDIDLADFVAWAECFTGPVSGFLSAACTCADLDGDGDADLGDLVSFQAAFTGSR